MTMAKKLTTRMRKNRIALIVTAAGLSTRFGGEKKEISLLPGLQIPAITVLLEIFVHTFNFSHYVVTVPSADEGAFKEAIFSSKILSNEDFSRKLFFVQGGATRQESVFNGLKFLERDAPDFVLIHDGARPWVSSQIIRNVIDSTEEFLAAAPGIPSVDTQKTVSQDGFIHTHLKRETVVNIQTPQGFDFGKILSAHEKSRGKNFTDDTAIFAQYFGKVKIVPGDVKNKKITYREDLMGEKTLRVGNGYDLHRLVPQRKLVLGGLEIPHEKGCLAHSDGDVLIHAILDALLGACAAGDIGEFFPPSDPKWKDAVSAEMLRDLWASLSEKGWVLENLDCVISAESPKILPLREKIRESLSSIMEVPVEKIFLKGKTAEGCGEIGAGEAISATAICLISRKA